MESNPPKYLYKIVSKEQWEESLCQNQVVLGSIDRDFIHLAKEEQVDSVVQKFWNNKGYMILKLDPQKFIGRLVYEKNPGGSNLYYHLYDGWIPLDAVVDATEA